MVDTVVLNLEWIKEFTIIEGVYNQFSPDITSFFKPPFIQFGGRKMVKANRNPTAKEKKDERYMPRLTLMKVVRKGSVPIILNIECSIPKVVHNNNFDEVTEADLDYFAVQLQRKLHNMGVVVKSPEVIKNATVSTIHYAKNIVLTDYTTAYEVLCEVGKCNYSNRKQIDRQKYRGGGEAVHFYSKNWGLCLYDKMNEYNKSKVSEKGRLEQDTYCQLSLFDDSPLKKTVQIVRIEARYRTRPHIGKALKDAGITPESLTLRHLFRNDIAKIMLKTEVAVLRDTYPAVSLSEKTPEQLVSELRVQNPNAHIGTIMQAVGYKTLLEATGSRDIRNIGNFTSQQWYGLNKKMNELNFDRRKLKSFDVIDEQLEAFIPVRLRKYTN